MDPTLNEAPEFKTKTVKVTKNSESYTESFGKVTFTEAGTYQWTVTETHHGETIDGIAYDKDDKTVTIVVVDDKKGHLVPAEGSSLLQIAEFNNPYSASGDGEILAIGAGRDCELGVAHCCRRFGLEDNGHQFISRQVMRGCDDGAFAIERDGCIFTPQPVAAKGPSLGQQSSGIVGIVGAALLQMAPVGLVKEHRARLGVDLEGVARDIF